MGLIQAAQQQAGQQPQQQAPNQQGNVIEIAIAEVKQLFEQGKELMLGRFGDGQGDVIDEVGETAAQLTRAITKKLMDKGVLLNPMHQTELLILTKDMLTDLCEDNGILKEAAEVQNRRMAAVAAAKYFKKYNMAEAEGGEQPTQQQPAQGEVMQ